MLNISVYFYLAFFLTRKIPLRFGTSFSRETWTTNILMVSKNRNLSRKIFLRAAALIPQILSRIVEAKCFHETNMSFSF